VRKCLKQAHVGGVLCVAYVSFTHVSIVVINVYKRFIFYFSIETRTFVTFFYFSKVFILKTLNSQCENNGNLKYLYTKTKNSKFCP